MALSCFMKSDYQIEAGSYLVLTLGRIFSSTSCAPFGERVIISLCGTAARARVEDAIRTGKETGMRRMPFAAFEHNAAWLEISLAAQALLRWAALLCLPGELALAEPKRVRQRLLHVAGRLVRSGRRVALRLPRSWPWAEALVAAFARLRALPAASP